MNDSKRSNCAVEGASYKRPTHRRIRLGHVILLCLGLLSTTEAPAHAAPLYRWYNRASGVKVVVNGDGSTYDGVTIDAWALSAQVGPGGGQRVNKGHWYCAGNCEFPYFQWSVDGGAEGTSIAWQGRDYWPGSGVGRLWMVGKDNSVWYRTTGGWFYLPANRCEGNGAPITVRQVVGDNALAVAYNSNVYVIESNGVPSNSVRWWTGSCWLRLPTPPGVPKAIAVWGAGALSAQTLPVVASTSGALYQWTGWAWNTIAAATGLGVGGTGTIIGMDGTSIWKFANSSGTSFQSDQWWGNNGSVRNIGSSTWVVRPDGNAFHLEYVGGF